jgi:hypothetical protein
MLDEYEDIKRRVEKLEGELAEAKKALEAVEDVPKPKMQMQKPDYTANFGMPGSAVKAMVGVVGEMRDRSKIPDTRRPSYSEPGGFGGPPKPRGTSYLEPEPEKPAEVKRGTGWVDAPKLEGRINEAEIKKRWSP